MNEISIQTTSLKYRPDIDGLRAVAVLSVLAYHLGAGHVPGGFVGVDIFFVISGFLISSILFSEIAESRFSVLAFYERRIRRIFPALFGMLIVFSIAAGLCLLPVELVTYAKSLLAAATSSSNFYFWQHSGYFDSPESNPLLHTWSLAVEEQFYILFPIFLVVTRRFFPERLRIAVAILFFASLAASIVAVYYSPISAFYMPYSRAWELLLGTLISLGFFPRLHSSQMRNLATLAGLGLIAYSLLSYSKKTPFPGVAALIPCVGSVLIIGAGQFGSSLVGRMLSWRPVVFVGLISYSLYLWHWPVIILHSMGLTVNLTDLLPDRYVAMLPMFRLDMWIEFLASFALAVLSWWLVESPFRRRRRCPDRRQLFAASVVAMLIVAAFSLIVILDGGFKRRFAPQAVKVASFLETHDAGISGQVGNCHVTRGNRDEVLSNDSCLQSVSGETSFLLLGDSHAAALWNGLAMSFPKKRILLVSLANCKPLLHSTGSSDCAKEMSYIFQSYLPSHPVQGLLLEARWKPKDMAGLTETIGWVKDHHLPVVVFGPVAEYDSPLPRLLAYSISWNKPNLATQHRLAYSPAMDAQMQNIATDTWHVPYVSLYKATCSGGACLEFADETHQIPLMQDEDHFTEAGSRLIVSRLTGQGELRVLNDQR